jgi:hypothetical protein
MRVKIKGLKLSDVDYKNGKATTWGICSKGALTGEGQRLLKKYPQYNYLHNDWDIKTEDQLYAGVVYAYIVDHILEENKGNNEIIQRYKQVQSWSYSNNPNNPNDKSTNRINTSFLEQYEDYLVEQKYPGIHERARRERYQQMVENENRLDAIAQQKQADEWRANIQLQQDLASGKRVVCPYCKSTNTEKISTVSRAVSVSLVGAASGKIGKQWHCKNCGSNF